MKLPDALKRIKGRSLVQGQWTEPQSRPATFQAINPATGEPLPPAYEAAGEQTVRDACEAAWVAYYEALEIDAVRRSAMLDSAADRIDALGELLVSMVVAETGLSPTRARNERERTTTTLRAFAELIREGSWCQATIDRGDRTRHPVALPDLRRMLRPLGPVVVFGASNFPLAYSTAGGDTASALAAGCPVIVKGHPAHPGTGELIARAVADAIEAQDFPAGMFAFLHTGGSRERSAGQELVRHPAVQAVGFTGSSEGGRALASLAQQRPSPIPVFAEMGSTNPVYVLPDAARGKAAPIAEALASSACAAAGQMCTCPGLLFLIAGPDSEPLIGTLIDRFNQIEPQTMLSPAIRSAFALRVRSALDLPGVDLIAGGVPDPGTSGPARALPALLRTNLTTLAEHPELRDETFGPCTLLVRCEDEDELAAGAALIQGSLTGTIHAGPMDAAMLRRLQRTLEHRVGRLIFNGVPTGVRVAPAMVHGGPHPATNRPESSAVGDSAIGRWCRPVCYQDAPQAALPPELRDSNPLRVGRRVDGAWETGPIARPSDAG